MNDRMAGLIFALVGVIVGALFVLCELEAYMYFTGEKKITYYVRNWEYGHWFWAIVLSLTVYTAVVVGYTHFILDGQGK